MTQCYRLLGSINTPVPAVTFKKVYTAAVNAPYAPPLVVVVYVVAVLAMFCAWVVMPNIWGLLVGQAVHGVMYAHMMVAIVTAEEPPGGRAASRGGDVPDLCCGRGPADPRGYGGESLGINTCVRCSFIETLTFTGCLHCSLWG